MEPLFFEIGKYVISLIVGAGIAMFSIGQKYKGMIDRIEAMDTHGTTHNNKIEEELKALIQASNTSTDKCLGLINERLARIETLLDIIKEKFK